jgi:hypothetical protein
MEQQEQILNAPQNHAPPPPTACFGRDEFIEKISSLAENAENAKALTGARDWKNDHALDPILSMKPSQNSRISLQKASHDASQVDGGNCGKFDIPTLDNKIIQNSVCMANKLARDKKDV